MNKTHGQKGNRNAAKECSKRGRIMVRVPIEVQVKASIRAQELGCSIPQYIERLVRED